VTTSPHVERRSAIRIAPKGSVILKLGGHVECGRVANISRYGLLAVLRDAPDPLIATGELEIEIRLDGAASGWLVLFGRVLRIVGHDVAITFDRVPPAFVDLMDNSSTASHGHRRVISVVLVDEIPERRLAIAEAFRAVGCAVVDVATPLHAIVRLGDSDFEPDLIAIADSLASGTADELRRFVEHDHPNAKLVSISDAAVQPDGAGIAHWLSSVQLDLLARIRELLARPKNERLAR
jgi:hypothetical protein